MIIFSPELVASRQAGPISVTMRRSSSSATEPPIAETASTDTHEQVFVDTRGTRLRAVLAFSSLLSACVVVFGLLVGISTTVLLVEQVPGSDRSERTTTGSTTDVAQPVRSTGDAGSAALQDRSGSPPTLWFSDPETHWVLCSDPCTANLSPRG